VTSDAVPARRGPASLVLLAVPVLMVVAFFVVPVGLMVVESFRTTASGGGTVWTADVYVRVLSDRIQWEALATTFGLAAAVTILSAVLGYPLAYVIVRGPNRLRPILFIIVIAPLLISLVARAFGWLVLLSDDGVVDRALTSLHLIGSDTRLLFSLPAVLMGLLHVQLPYMVLSITTGLADADLTVEEAAMSLGANRAATFARVTLPLSLRGVAAGAVIVFGLTIGSYAMPALLGGGKVRVTAMDVYDQVFLLGDWAYAAATGIVLLLSTFVLTALISGVLARRKAAVA
jgi:putative spermidine/putrescine transport system permease protein